MKQKFFSILAFVIFTITSNVLSQKPYKLPEAISEVYNNINLVVSPQVELISIVQTISQYSTVFDFLMAKDNFNYKIDAINYFESFKAHPAVLMFDRLSLQPRMLNFSAPSNIMLYTDKSLNLRENIEMDDFVINRAGGKDSLRIFLELLKDFAFKSSFNEFYASHQNFFSTIIENTIKSLGATNYISELESFYGVKQNSYNIILVSLYNHVGFGNSLLCANHQREIYNTLGPDNIIDEIPFFGEDYLKYMVRHEFSHPFINPLTEKYWYYIKDYENKFDSIPEAARKNVCGEWQECINEFIIRAITTQIAINENNDLGLQLYEIEKKSMIVYLDGLLKKIRYYQSNRQSFPSFESYYLNILDVFKEE